MNLKYLSAGALALSAVAMAGLPAQETKDAARTARLDIFDTAAEAGTFQTLLTAAKAAGLVDTLKGKGPMTLFAPTDEAFKRLPAGTVEALLLDKPKLTAILKYHLMAQEVPAAKLIEMTWGETMDGQSFRIEVSDDGVTVDGARIVKADVRATNGIIHVIDTVIMPRPNIVDTAVAAGSFKTLATALKAAGLIDALKGNGPFTVFAPTDAAFAKLPEGTLEAWLNDVPKLQAILKYHVVSGRYHSDDLPASSSFKTLQGDTVNVKKSKDGKVTVNEVNVTATDILAGNGVIYSINTVIVRK